MVRVSFKSEFCKGCGLCQKACPRQLISLSEDINAMGYHVAQITDQEKCLACAFCASMCPDLVITIAKEEK